MKNKKFDFWQDHSTNYLEMAFKHDRRETVQNPDGYGKNTGECGDTVEIFISVRDDKIDSVSFNIDGCMNTNACANTIAHLTEGRSIEGAWKISPEDVANFLETLPEHETHCAELAVGAFYRALVDYTETRKNVWKKPYKRS